ncbi:hypothetical protein [Fibrobacter succinogenes]|uniref:hypothetical protein n=1 Tax=Fibrobacter succinogenes TaxID=833 RepID=UPI00059EA9A5|nr:hypothetical protein [Fibrobacter succinogenes]
MGLFLVNLKKLGMEREFRDRGGIAPLSLVKFQKIVLSQKKTARKMYIKPKNNTGECYADL